MSKLDCWLNIPLKLPLINFSSIKASSFALASSMPSNTLYKSSIKGGLFFWVAGSVVMPFCL